MVARVIKLRESTKAASTTKTASTTRTTSETPDQIMQPNEHLSQRKRPEIGRYLLQIDRQTKESFATAEEAEVSGMAIKTRHPVVQVSVYDSVECKNTVVELPDEGR
jgi:hypothetical protein